MKIRISYNNYYCF